MSSERSTPISHLILKVMMKIKHACLLKLYFRKITSLKTTFYLVIPVIKEKPRVIKVQKTRVIIVESIVKCAAPPQVQWYREQTVVKEDNRRVVRVQQTMKVHFKTMFYAIETHYSCAEL